MYLETMKWFGWWSELYGSPFPSLQDHLTDGYSPEQKEKVLELLQQGLKLEMHRTNYCWIEGQSCPHFQGHGTTYVLYSNTEWIWNSEVIHLVRHHGLVLPEDFLTSLSSLREIYASPSFLVDCANEINNLHSRRSAPSQT